MSRGGPTPGAAYGPGMESDDELAAALDFVGGCSGRDCSREWGHEGDCGQDPSPDETCTYLEPAQRETRTRGSRQ